MTFHVTVFQSFFINAMQFAHRDMWEQGYYLLYAYALYLGLKNIEYDDDKDAQENFFDLLSKIMMKLSAIVNQQQIKTADVSFDLANDIKVN